MILIPAAVLVCFFSCEDGNDAVSPPVGGARRDVWFVDAGAAGLDDGGSWEDAFTHPQSAVDAAETGEQVWIAAGVYASRDTSDRHMAVLALREGVSVYGGFEPGDTSLTMRDAEANPTVLDGEGVACHVVTGADGALMDGFTVTGGRAEGQYPDDSGAGMLNNGVSPTVANCILTGNRCDWLGGGMFNYRSGAEVTGCTFENNEAGYDGAGVCNDSEGSSAGMPVFTDCVFVGNACRYGAGIYNHECPSVISGCTFNGNLADHSGGGACNIKSAVLIVDCVFTNNISFDSGAGMYNNSTSSRNVPVITNCLFIDNEAGSSGGGMNNYNSPAKVSLCTFAHNAAESGGGISSWNSSARITDCIVWWNDAVSSLDNIEIGYGEVPVISFSNIDQGGYGSSEDGTADGSGNIRLDPLFVSGPAGDYYLSQTAAGQTVESPCVDSGSDLSNSLDMSGGTTRTDTVADSGVVDMGYHYFR